MPCSRAAARDWRVWVAPMGRAGKRLGRALWLVVSIVLGSAGTPVSSDRFTIRCIGDYHIERVLATQAGHAVERGPSLFQEVVLFRFARD